MPSTPRYWVNGDADGMWNNANNWSASSGGAGGAGTPGATETAIFDSAITDSCQMNVGVSIQGLIIYSGYTGTLDADTDDLNHEVLGNVSFQDGTINMGSGMWSIGSLEVVSPAAFNHNGGTISIDLAGSFNLAAGTKLATVIINNTCTLAADLEVDGHIEVTATGTLSGGAYDLYMGDGAYIQVDGSGSLAATTIYATTGTIMGVVNADVEYKVNGDGTAYLGIGFTCNDLLLEQLGASGTYTVDGSLNGDVYTVLGSLTTVTAGGNLELNTGSNSFRVAENVDLSALSTFNPGSGEFALVGGTAGPYAVTLQDDAVAQTSFNILRIEDSIRTFGTDDFWGLVLNMNGGTMDLATNDPEVIWMVNCNLSGGTVNMGSGTWSIEGTFYADAGTTVSGASATLKLAGTSGTSTIDCGGKTYGTLTIDAAGATKQLTGAAVVGACTLTAGTLDVNGQTLTCDTGTGSGNFTVGTGGQMVGTGLNGCTITVEGNLNVDGELGDLLDWAASSAWTLTVTGTATADYVDVAYCDASGGTQITPTNCTDSGNNTNWDFPSGPVARTWNDAGDGKWSTAANWTPNGVPGTDPGDIVTFDGTSGANCRMDAAVTLAGITLAAGYSGTLDAATDNLNHTVGTLTVAVGTLSAGSGTWTIGDGGLSIAAGATFNHNSGTILMSTATGATACAGGGKTFNNLTIAASLASTLLMGNLTVAGTLSIGANSAVSLTATDHITVNGTLTVAVGGSLTSAATAKVTLASGASISGSTGTINPYLLDVYGNKSAAQFPARTYGAVKFNNASDVTVTYAAGTYNFTDLTYSNTTVDLLFIDAATNDPTINVSGNLATVNSGGGTLRIDMGDGTWTVAGNCDVSAATTFNANAGKLVMSGTGKTLTSTALHDFNNLTISGTITQSGSLDVNGILQIEGTYTLNTGSTYRMLSGSNLKITGTGTLAGTGSLGLNSTAQVSQQDGTISITAIDCSNITGALVPATYGCTTFTFAGVGTSVFTFSAGTYNFVNLQIRATGGSNTVDAATNNPTINVTGNLTSTLVAGATVLQMGSGTWTVKGNVDLSTITTLTAGTSTLALAGAGSGTQTINIGGKTLNGLTINDSGATKRISATGFTSAALTLTVGTLDCATNNPSPNITGNVTAAAGTITMGTGTWTVAGNLDLSAVTTLTASGATINMSGASKTLDAFNDYAGRAKTLQISGSTTVAGSALNKWCDALQVLAGGTLTIPTTFTVTPNITALSLPATATITGAGKLKARTGVSLLSGTLNVSTLECDLNPQLAAGTYGSATVLLNGTGATATPASGTLSFSGDLTISNTTAGANVFAANTNNPTINVTGNVTTVNSGGGTLTVSMGSGTWTIAGNWDASAAATFTCGTSTLKMTGTAKTLKGIDGWNTRLYGLTITGTITLASSITHSGPGRIEGTLTLGGFTLTSVLSTSGRVIAGGSVTGSGTWVMDRSDLLEQSGTINCTTFRWGSNASPSTLAPGTYDATNFQIAGASGTFVPSAGTYIIKGTINKADWTSAAAVNCSVNNPSWEFWGAVQMLNTNGVGNRYAWTRGSGTITLKGVGSGTQIIDFDGNTMEAITVNDSGATKQLDGTAFTTAALALTAGTLDAATNNPSVTVDGNFTAAAGTITMGTGIWTVGGNVDLSGAASITASSATIRMTGASKTYKWGSSGYGQRVNVLQIDGTVALTSTPTNPVVNTLSVQAGGTCTIPTGVSLTVNGAAVACPATAIITGAGTLYARLGVSDIAGTINTAVMRCDVSPTLVAGSYGSASVLLDGASVATIISLGAGTFNFAGNVTLESTSTGSPVLRGEVNNPTVNITGNFTVAMLGAGVPELRMGSGTWTVGGNVTVAAAATLTPGTSTLALAGAGAGTQTIDLAGKTFNILTVNDTGATKRFTGNFVAGTLNLTAGTIDNAASDPSYTVRGNMTLAAGLVYNAGDGVITLAGAGAGAQVLTTNGQTIEDVLINDAGATKRIAGNLSTGGLTVQAGTFDPTGFDVTTGGDFLIQPGAVMDDPVGSTFNIGGDTYLYGTSGAAKLDLDASGTWYLNTTGEATAQYVSVTSSDASGGSTVNATGSDDNGNNTNWDFNVPVPPGGLAWHSGRRPIPQLYLYTGGLW